MCTREDDRRDRNDRAETAARRPRPRGTPAGWRARAGTGAGLRTAKFPPAHGGAWHALRTPGRGSAGP